MSDDTSNAQRLFKALESSSSRLTTKYANRPTDNHIKSASEVLKVLDQEIEISKPTN